MPAGMLLAISNNSNSSSRNNSRNDNNNIIDEKNRTYVPEGNPVLYNPSKIDGERIFDKKGLIIGQGTESIVYLSEYEGRRYIVRVQKSDYIGRLTFIKNTQKYISVLGYDFVIPLLYAKVFVPYKTKTKSKYASWGYNFQIMPYIEGQTLDKFDGNSLDYKIVLSIIEQLEVSLRSLADDGFVHRDIKPANIFLSDSGKVYLIDFDTLCSGADCLNFSEQIVGSYNYSKPNAITAERPYMYTPKYDLWSLGKTIGELAKKSSSKKQDLISIAIGFQVINKIGGKTRKHKRKVKRNLSSYNKERKST